jgi:tRNA-dihydrouridine synthase 1
MTRAAAANRLLQEFAAGHIRYVAAPMVCQSDLPYRLLMRKHGAQLAYTPMIHADRFLQGKRFVLEVPRFVLMSLRHVDPSCRDYYFQTTNDDSQADRPLVAQFCGSDAQTILAAAKIVQHDCDAIDLNLGCPQVAIPSRVSIKL